MGLFGASQPTTPTSPKPSNDGGFIAPDRSARAMCWEARDAFFECLDRNSIIDSIKHDTKARDVCGTEHVGFEKNCVSSWLTYFKKRRVMEYQRDQTLKRLDSEGAKTLSGENGSFGGTPTSR